MKFQFDFGCLIIVFFYVNTYSFWSVASAALLLFFVSALTSFLCVCMGGLDGTCAHDTVCL